MTVLMSPLGRRRYEKSIGCERREDMELEACWTETEWLVKCHDCIVNNIAEEHCPPMPLPIPPDYVHNLERSEMAVKGILPPPLRYSTRTTHCHLSRHGRRHSATHPRDDRLYSSRRHSSNVLEPRWSRQRKRWWNDRRKMFV